MNDNPFTVLLVEDDARAAILIGEVLRVAWDDGLVLARTERLSDAIKELLGRGATCVLLDLCRVKGRQRESSRFPALAVTAGAVLLDELILCVDRKAGRGM